MTNSVGARPVTFMAGGIAEELLEVRIVDAVVADPACRLLQRRQSLLRLRNAVGVSCRPQFGYAFCRAGDFGLQPPAGLGACEQVVIVLPEPLGDSTGCCRFTVIGNDRSPIRMRPLCSLSTVS